MDNRHENPRRRWGSQWKVAILSAILAIPFEVFGTCLHFASVMLFGGWLYYWYILQVSQPIWVQALVGLGVSAACIIVLFLLTHQPDLPIRSVNVLSAEEKGDEEAYVTHVVDPQSATLSFQLSPTPPSDTSSSSLPSWDIPFASVSERSDSLSISRASTGTPEMPTIPPQEESHDDEEHRDISVFIGGSPLPASSSSTEITCVPESLNDLSLDPRIDLRHDYYFAYDDALGNTTDAFAYPSSYPILYPPPYEHQHEESYQINVLSLDSNCSETLDTFLLDVRDE